MKIFLFRLAWENSQHFTMPPKVSLWNDIWETSTEIPFWWCITTQIWVVLMILPAVWPIRGTTEILAVPRHQYETSAFVSQTSFHGWQRGGKVWGLISENPEARGVIQQVPSVGVVWIFSGTTQYYDLQLRCGISKCFIWWMLVHMVAEVYTCRYQIYKTSCPSLIVT